MAAPKEYMEKEEPTFPCKICSRKFIRSSLEKHIPACKKLSKLNRKPFDSGKQRATGSDLIYADVKKAQKEKEKNGGQFPRPQTNWKQRHETFIDAVSSSKKVDYAIKTGAPLPPPPKTAVPNDYAIPSWSDVESDEDDLESMLDDESQTGRTVDSAGTESVSSWVPNDYVQCEYCGRNFNEHVAERHIPFCRDQHKSKGLSMKSSSPKPMTAARPPTNKIKTRDASPTRAGRLDTRATNRDDVTNRRSSLESRAMVASRQSPARTNTQSATQSRQQLPPTPNKRSNSAPRTPGASRLKTPGVNKGQSSGSKERAPKTRDSRRDTSTSRSQRPKAK